MIMAHNWHEYLPVLHAVSLNESYTAWVGCCPSPIRLPWWVVKWLHSHGDWLRGIRQSKFLIVWGFFLFFSTGISAPVWYRDMSAVVIQWLIKEKMLVHIFTSPDFWKLWQEFFVMVLCSSWPFPRRESMRGLKKNMFHLQHASFNTYRTITVSKDFL